ncbi:C-type lectin domain family 4 member A-like [Lampris incognitus]|uniref:C-type lectin domain family 4 member A-like n=1 Tax=Lampris incognitus TaxID=2546036 RepID=UPI0024B5867E|nr:C-type lectin domain family 4 member A-like [Lampris incognitus]
MSKEACTKPSTNKKVHFEKDEKEERIVDIYVSTDNLTIYDNPWVEMAVPANLKGTTETPPRPAPAVGVSSEKGNRFKATAGCLGLLCLLLLLGIISLGVLVGKYKTAWTSSSKLTQETDQIQDRFNKLQKAFASLRDERDELKAANAKLIRETEETCCSDGWQWFRGSCYFISKTKRTWWSSKDCCERNDADLVTITSQEEQDFISEKVSQEGAWVRWRREEEGKRVDETPLDTELDDPTEHDNRVASKRKLYVHSELA